MGQKIPFAIKEKVIDTWLEAKPRNVIADEVDISYGSVSNIIAQTKRDSIKDIDLLRAVAVLLKKNNFDLTFLASSIRLQNRLTDL
jgi:hypothetical protein